MTHRLAIGSLLLLSVVATALPAFAQEEPTRGFAATDSGMGDGSELSSCFDYYRFGSVPVSISAELESVSAGAPITFRATALNENTYPLPNLSIYVKVFRTRDLEGKNVNGPDVVAFERVAQNVSLDAGESTQAVFTWQVPTDIEPGDYRIASYVVQEERFAYLGLTFTDDIVGGSYRFKVINDREGAVRFDKEGTTLAGKIYRFAAYPPLVSPTVTDVPVTFTIRNTTTEDFEGDVEWRLSVWDALLPNGLIEEKSTHVSIPAGGATEVSYTVTNRDHSVYYLLASLKTDAGSQSIVATRFVRHKNNEPRLSSLTAMEYPAVEGTTAVACFHTSGSERAENVRVELSAKTAGGAFGSFFGQSLGTKTYTGIAPGDISALAMPLTAASDSFILSAKVYQNGALVDEVNIPYTCSTLGTPCPFDWPLAILTAVAILALILLILWGIRMRRAARASEVPPYVPPSPTV